MPDSAAVKTRLRDELSTRIARVRKDFFQSLQIVASGVGAYYIAEQFLGHHEPIFAATAAIVSLGYVSGATHARRILEVSLGVILGIAIGDVLMLLMGQGMWQATFVLFISIQIARFLDKGILFTIQMGLQSTLVVLLPPSPDGVFARSLDGIVGGLCAFLLMFIFPKDPRKEPRRNASALMNAFADVFYSSAKAMKEYDGKAAWLALSEARQLQPLFNKCEADVVTAIGLAKLSIVGKSQQGELKTLSKRFSATDLAIRNTRVLNRRMASTLENVQLSSTAVDSLAQVFVDIGNAVHTLGEGMSAKERETRRGMMHKARTELEHVAATLEPHQMKVETLEGESLVLMTRPLVVDLLEVTGLSHEDAVDQLVPLGESITERAPKTNILPVIAAPQTSAVRVESLLHDVPQEEAEQPVDTAAINTVLRTRAANSKDSTTDSR
ncbi:aromatic acid exporter family protein [Rothia sp. ZJ1223]|uniref:FUSC family protein n=1 Tax=Rothia sp. ZJ1223 TaxID=2811098 RepID=UPI00195CA92C|nr:FUSC family protein [Rothia sp. ZJ1223]MBM7051592.1 FUSC family protein [Rothia sp. ZJ1223]